jgi:hypothetical protein
MFGVIPPPGCTYLRYMNFFLCVVAFLNATEIDTFYEGIIHIVLLLRKNWGSLM